MHPSTLSAESHRSPYPLASQLDRRAAGLNSITLTAREGCLGVVFDLLGDLLESSHVGAAVVLGGGTDHATRIGDEIGHHQDSATVKHGFRFRRRRDVRTLQDKLGTDCLGIPGVYAVRSRRRH
jgi:hypothetical protein